MPRRFKKSRWKSPPKVHNTEMELVFTILKELIWELPPPWEAEELRDQKGRRIGGRPPYPARPLALVCIMMVYYDLTLRNVESLFAQNKEWLWEMEVAQPPDKNTIGRGLQKLPLDYMEALEKNLMKELRREGL